MHVIRLVPCTFLNIGKPPPQKKSTNFALRTHKNCLLVRVSLGLGFRAVTYTGWISFSVENKHSGSVYSYKSDRMLLHVFPGKNSIFWAFWLKNVKCIIFRTFFAKSKNIYHFSAILKNESKFFMEKILISSIFDLYNLSHMYFH